MEEEGEGEDRRSCSARTRRRGNLRATAIAATKAAKLIPQECEERTRLRRLAGDD